MTVLVLATERDVGADRMVRALSDRGVPVFRADLSWFPQRLTLDAELRAGRWVGCLATAHRAVALEEVRSVWYRNPSSFRFPAAMSGVERRHAQHEAKLGVGGVLASLPVRWVNPPGRHADAGTSPVSSSQRHEQAWTCCRAWSPTMVPQSAGSLRGAGPAVR